MNNAALSLPGGRRGQALALAMLMTALLLVWFGAVAPLFGWYQDRAETLAQRQAVAARLVALVGQAPALRAAGNAASDDTLLDGSSDTIAGADLQSRLQTMAAAAGVSLDSSAPQAGQQAGRLRRISTQITMTCSWTALVGLLRAIGTGSTAMTVDTLNLSALAADGTQAADIHASLTVSGFR